MQGFKFCKDCKYAVPEKNLILFFSRWTFARCSHPSAATDDNKNKFFVTGNEKFMKTEFMFCSTMRGFSNLCGSKAKGFEAK